MEEVGWNSIDKKQNGRLEQSKNVKPSTLLSFKTINDMIQRKVGQSLYINK